MNRIISIIALSAAITMAQTTTVNHTQAEIDAHRAKIETAIQARDYTTWKAEHEAWNPGDTRLSGKITAENFDKFAQMREARLKGDMTTAQKLRDELGVQAGGQGMGAGKGKGQGKGQCTATGTGSTQTKGQGNGQGKGQGMGQGKHNGMNK